MKRILLALIIVAAACTGIGIKENCKTQYSDNGVVFSQLKPDYAKTYKGGTLRFNIEITNMGEKQAGNIEVMCTNPSTAELSCPDPAVFYTKSTLNPPDPSACIEGEAGQKQIKVDARLPTGEEPAYFRARLSYDYSSLSWSEVNIVSETQWRIRTQQGVKPVQSAYQSAAPIKIELGVPDAPLVYEPAGENKFPLTIALKNVFEGYGYPQTTGMLGDKNYRVSLVNLTAPSAVRFVSDKCKEGASPTQTCTLEDLEISTEDEPKSYTVTAKIVSFQGEEETYKITAEAKYRYIVKEASQQGVEIKAG